MCSSLLFRVCFFQAEDGIRDLVRSRGLGDVYKRQDLQVVKHSFRENINAIESAIKKYHQSLEADTAAAVSYTHLTLPTSDLV